MLATVGTGRSLLDSVAQGPILALLYARAGVLDTRESFTRSSLATQYSSTGNLVYAPHNFVLRSENFAVTPWTLDSGVTGTALGDGYTRLQTVANGISQHRVQQNLGSFATYPVQSIVADVRPGTNRYVVIGMNAGAVQFGVCFDTQTGQVTHTFFGSTGAYYNSYVANNSDGSYRVEVVGSGGQFAIIGLSNTATPGTLSPSFSGDGTSFADIARVQVSALLSSTQRAAGYMSTTTAAVYGPRFDSDPATLTALGTRIEESRTNLALQSNQFDTTWALGGAGVDETIAAASGTSPDGSNNAWKLVEKATTASHNVNQSFTKAASALPYTLSVFAKISTGRTRLMMEMWSTGLSVGVKATYDLSGGQIGIAAATIGAGWSSPGATITSVGSGWYRIALTGTSDTNTNLNVGFFLESGSGTGAETTTYLGTVGNGILIYGAQLEQAAFATSYIPTTTAAATRAADSDTITLSSVGIPANPTGLTIIGKVRTASGGSGNHQVIFQIDDTSNNNRCILRREASTNSLIAYAVVAGTVVFSGNIATAGTDTDYSFWINFAPNDFAASIVGGAKVTDVAGAMPTGLNILRIGNSISSEAWNSTIAALQFFNRRLPDAEAAARAAAL